MFFNIILDPLFIFGLNMGFVGAAYASLAGQVIASLILTWLGLKRVGIYLFFHPSFITKGRIYHILVGGAPHFARQGISTLSLVLLNLMAANYGETVIAAMTLSTRVLAFVYMLMIGWGQGFQPICAMNYGIGRYDRVRELFRLTVKTGTAFLILSGSLMALFAGFFVGILTQDGELAVCPKRHAHAECRAISTFLNCLF